MENDQSERLCGMNIIQLLLIALVWTIGIIYTVKIARRNEVAIWRAVIVLLVSIFSLSFTIHAFNMTFKVAILPLGVWLIYFILRNTGTWKKYRHVAWFGFLLNYAFLVVFFISQLIHPLIYHPEKLTTYITNPEKVKLVPIMPTETKRIQLTSELLKQASVNDLIFNDGELMYGNLFPYLLINHEAKRGSAIRSKIYVQNDGKGILVHHNEKQYYFTIEQSVFEEGK